LLAEEVELGYIGGRYDDERVHFEEMGQDTIVCAVARGSLDAPPKSLSQAELCKVPLVVREQGSGTQKAVYEALAGTWINREALRVVAVLGSSEAVKRALLEGAGYAFISRMSLEGELASGVLTTVRIPGLTISRKIYAASRAGRELSPAASAFLATMLANSTTYLNKR